MIGGPHISSDARSDAPGPAELWGFRATITVSPNTPLTTLCHPVPMARFRSRRRDKGLLLPVAVFVGLFGGTTYVLTPDAPGKAQAMAAISKRTTDQHYSGCREARANNHENIDSWEPSYRSEMDGDEDGIACETYRTS